MEQIIVQGGRPLGGSVRVNGAKNAALPIMAASILTEGPTVLHRVPRLTDVETISEILRALGVALEWIGPDSLRLEPTANGPVEPPLHLVREMRASVCVLGPLLAMRGAASMAMPGGCVIGRRPIDLHLKGLRALGARFEAEDPYIRAEAGRLRGAPIDMAGPRGSTVLGTANVIMAATLAEGRTVIDHAAREPEIQDLARFLNACGARIRGAGTPRIVVDGVRGLHGTDHSIIADRIEAGTFLAAVGAAGGEITLAEACPEHMRAVLGVMRRMGLEFRLDGGELTARRAAPLRAVDLVATPHPGVPTDMQPQLTAVLCLAGGESTVCDTVYPGRFTHVAELERMGACISRRPGKAIVRGVDSLRGASVAAADLRAGAALVVAGLASQGTTTISGTEQIDRGHEDLEERLRELGADISRVDGEPLRAGRRKSA